MQKLDDLSGKLGLDKLEKMKPVKKIVSSTGLTVGQLGLIVSLVLSVFLVLEYGSCLISDGLGFIYPAYMSFKALESPDFNDDKLWLTYWVVYAFMALYRVTLGQVFRIIPFYDLLRLLFYIYLFHPKTEGAVTLYDSLFKPMILLYETEEQITEEKKEE